MSSSESDEHRLKEIEEESKQLQDDLYAKADETEKEKKLLEEEKDKILLKKYLQESKEFVGWTFKHKMIPTHFTVVTGLIKKEKIEFHDTLQCVRIEFNKDSFGNEVYIHFSPESTSTEYLSKYCTKLEDDSEIKTMLIKKLKELWDWNFEESKN